MLCFFCSEHPLNWFVLNTGRAHHEHVALLHGIMLRLSMDFATERSKGITMRFPTVCCSFQLREDVISNHTKMFEFKVS